MKLSDYSIYRLLSEIIHPPVTFTRGLASAASACSLSAPNVTNLSQPSQLYPAGSGDMRAQ